MAEELTNRDDIARLYGSFWTETYESAKQVFSLAGGIAELNKQAQLDIEEVLDSVSRETIRPYHRERWYPITLRRSELNNTTGSLLHFGTGAVFGTQNNGDKYFFGVPTTELFKFPAPAYLVGAGGITTRIGNTGRIWTFGVDVELSGGLLIFKENPLDDDMVAVDQILTENDTDVAAQLWLRDAEFDFYDVYTQFGFVHGLPPYLDSRIQKEGMLAISRAVVGGTSLETFKELVAAGTGVPITKTEETVVAVDSSGSYPFVATNSDVYRIPDDSTITHAVGDVLPPGTFLTDDVSVVSFSQDNIPQWFTNLTLTPGIAATGFTGSLALVNNDVPLSVKTVDDERYVSFPIGASPEDTKLFFDTVHARGLASGKTVIESIEESYGYTPTTINPLQFFITNWFRGTLLVVRVSGAALNSVRWSHLQQLRRMTPPNLLLVVLVDIDMPKTAVAVGSPSISSFVVNDPADMICAIGTPRVSCRNVITNCE